MGADSSKSVQSLDRHLSSTERDQLEAVLKKLIDDKQRITITKLQALLRGKLPEDAIERLFVFMHNIPGSAIKDKTNYVSREQFVTCLVQTLKGSNEQMATILLCLASSNKLNDVSKLLSILLRLCYESLFGTEAFKSWRLASDYTREKCCEHLIDDLGHRDQTISLSVDVLERWLNGSTTVPQILRRAFHQCFSVGDTSELPSLIPVCKSSNNKQLRLAQTILDLSAVHFINSSIPHELRTEWRLLFDSRTQGESFSTMIRSVIDSGPTVIIVRDKDQHVFGGFASESWLSQARFYGRYFTMCVHEMKLTR